MSPRICAKIGGEIGTKKNPFFLHKLSKYIKLPILTYPIKLLAKENTQINGGLKMQTATENRKDVRTDLAWPVSVWMPESNRFFNGKSHNISKSGALLTLTDDRAGSHRPSCRA